MKEHIMGLFEFNNVSNSQLIEKISLVPDKTDSVRLMSHIINCQFKWIARLQGSEHEKVLDWWEPVYNIDVLQSKWIESLRLWSNFINSCSEDQLSAEISFKGMDGNFYAASPADVALHLNYHSIHHRAQILSLLSKQGVKAEIPDYIRTKITRSYK
jgi:uncharacterized damage-inducible protein DinB